MPLILGIPLATSSGVHQGYGKLVIQSMIRFFSRQVLLKAALSGCKRSAHKCLQAAVSTSVMQPDLPHLVQYLQKMPAKIAPNVAHVQAES